MKKSQENISSPGMYLFAVFELKVAGVEAVIGALLGDQIVVGATLDNAAVI
jgi:hypothetical protein